MTRRFKLIATTLAGAAGALAMVGAVLATEAGPAYLAVQSWSADEQGPHGVGLSATATGEIPRLADTFIASQLIAGIAWADLDSGTAVVATIHPAIGRDSFQRPDAWHLHTVRLTGGATAPNDFCLVEVSSTPTAGIQIHGATMTINIRASELPAVGGVPIPVSAIDAAVGFTVHSGDAGCESGLGVRIRT